MRPIEVEQNIEIVKQYVVLLEDTVKNLNQRIAKLEKKNAEDAQAWLSEHLQDQLHRLQKKFFGFGREKNPALEARPTSNHRDSKLNPHGEYQVELDLAPNPDQKETQVKRQNRKDLLAKVHLFTESELAAESQIRGVMGKSDAWKQIQGLYQESTEILVTERTYQKVVHKQAKYRLKDEYNTTDKEVIITAPGPAKLRPNSQYSIDFAVQVVTDKYEWHLPLERQRRMMQEAGLEVEVKTLYGLCEAVAEHMAPITKRIRKEILSDFCAAHIDESPWRILKEGTTGQLWVFSNRLGAYYQFEPTRSGKIAQELAKDHTGAIVCDGYGGYNQIKKKPGARVQHCWSHARREFYERWEDYPKEVEQALSLIDQLFDIEADSGSIANLIPLRRTKSKEVIDEFRLWCEQTRLKFPPSSGIVKAIDYCFKFWGRLTHFLKDASVPIQNNDAERALRHAVVGRKNFLGCQTINGADTMATLYTIIESCKRARVHPKEYLTYAIEEKWHQREPKTPLQYGVARYGNSKKAIFPDPKDWQI